MEIHHVTGERVRDQQVQSVAVESYTVGIVKELDERNRVLRNRVGVRRGHQGCDNRCFRIVGGLKHRGLDFDWLIGAPVVIAAQQDAVLVV